MVLVGGASSDDGQRILIDLVDVLEEGAFASEFERRGWTVDCVSVLWPIVRILAKSKPDLAITDKLASLSVIRQICGEYRPAIIVVVENDESKAGIAWKSGADWVIARPIYPCNPLSAMPPG
jgi:DNA-binding response OmpR family regulator